jgi:hypothetical protein
MAELAGFAVNGLDRVVSLDDEKAMFGVVLPRRAFP